MLEGVCVTVLSVPPHPLLAVPYPLSQRLDRFLSLFSVEKLIRNFA